MCTGIPVAPSYAPNIDYAGIYNQLNRDKYKLCEWVLSSQWLCAGFYSYVLVFFLNRILSMAVHQVQRQNSANTSKALSNLREKDLAHFSSLW